MDAPRTTARGTALGVTVLVLGLLGVVVGVLLWQHVRVSCGSDIDRLVELYCNHRSHPYRTLGIVVTVVSALVGANGALALAIPRMRSRTSEDE